MTDTLRRNALALDHDAGHHEAHPIADCRLCATGAAPSPTAVRLAGPRS